jgi:uncharacterized membrane protein
VIRHLAARPLLGVAIAGFGVAAAALWWLSDWAWPTICLIAWNFSVSLLLALDFAMMARSDEKTLFVRAALLDDGQEVILAMSVAAAIASLVAIVAELGAVRDLTGLPRAAHIGLAALTVVSSWSFIQVMFAVHYAHDWARRRHSPSGPGLHIPGEDNPDYWDFLYVAVVIGTSGQTADVEFVSKRMRRVGLAHSALAFFFNTVVLALTINIAAGLI